MLGTLLLMSQKSSSCEIASKAFEDMFLCVINIWRLLLWTESCSTACTILSLVHSSCVHPIG